MITYTDETMVLFHQLQNVYTNIKRELEIVEKRFAYQEKWWYAWRWPKTVVYVWRNSRSMLRVDVWFEQAEQLNQQLAFGLK